VKKILLIGVFCVTGVWGSCVHVPKDVSKPVSYPYQLKGKVLFPKSKGRTRFHFKKIVSRHWQWLSISTYFGKPLWIFEIKTGPNNDVTLNILDAIHGCRAQVKKVNFLGHAWRPLEIKHLLNLNHHEIDPTFVQKLKHRGVSFETQEFYSPLYRKWIYENPEHQVTWSISRFEPLSENRVENLKARFFQQKTKKFKKVDATWLDLDTPELLNLCEL